MGENNNYKTLQQVVDNFFMPRPKIENGSEQSKFSINDENVGAILNVVVEISVSISCGEKLIFGRIFSYFAYFSENFDFGTKVENSSIIELVRYGDPSGPFRPLVSELVTVLELLKELLPCLKKDGSRDA